MHADPAGSARPATRLGPGLFWRLVLRETRGGGPRVGLFALCLGIGVAAVVSIAGLARSLEHGIRAEARQLLAADLEVAGRRPIPPEVDALLATVPGVGRVDVKEMVTVVAAGSRAPSATALSPGEPPAADDASRGTAASGAVHSQLVELKAVSPGYPFYGTLELSPARPLGELLRADTAVVAPDLLSRLGLAIGDTLLVGGHGFRVTATVSREPDRISDAFSSGPRVFLSLDGLARTGLDTTGSRIRHQALVRLPENAPEPLLADLAARLTAALPDDERFRVETYAEAQPNLRTGLDRVDRFLGLVALLSLLVGGVGVAQTVRAWLAGRLDAIAVLRCLGLRPNEVLLVFLAQVALLALAGSLLGGILGLTLQLIVPSLLGDLVPARLIQVWQPVALLKGLLLGVGVSLLFSLPPLVAARRGAADPRPATRRRAVA